MYATQGVGRWVSCAEVKLIDKSAVMHLIARHSTGQYLLVLGFPFLNFGLIMECSLILGMILWEQVGNCSSSK